MSKLVALRFDDPALANEALARLEAAHTSDAFALYDALTISWPEDERHPQTRRPLYLSIPGKGIETLQRVAMGILYILLTLGSAALFIAGQLRRHGMNPDFVARIKDQIAAGTSILVILTDESAADAVNGLLADLTPTEIGSNSFTNEEKGASE